MSELLYDALMLGRNKKVAAEEYQVATGRKQSAAFSTKEEQINISNVISDGEFSVHLFQTVPGYIEIEVFCEDNFLIFDRKVINTDEFQNGQFEFKFMLISDRLHNGRNCTAISFRTSSQTIEVPVNIDNRIRVRIGEGNPRERIFRLMKSLLKLQIGQSEQWEWAKESQELLNEIPGEDEVSLYLMLYKAQVFITGGDDVHARNYIEHVGTQIPKLEKKNYDIYCYFIYLASLYEELEGVANFAAPGSCVTELRAKGNRKSRRVQPAANANIMDMSALQKVQWVYDHNPSWWILWILFYMDPDYRFDPEARLRKMQEMFYEYSCTSPFLYLEAFRIIRENPQLVKEADAFLIHVLHFAAKNECLDRETSEQMAEVLLSSKESSLSLPETKIACEVFRKAYQQFKGVRVLKELCYLLIDADDRDLSSHTYFEQVIRNKETDELFYDYYIYTLDQSEMNQIDPSVMQYFLEHTELLYEYKAYMYANIIANKYYDQESYRKGIEQILRFAEHETAQGHNNEVLAVIYKEILENGLLTRVMKDNLFDIVCTRGICCENERMRSVLVFHKELQVYQESGLKNKKAYIRIYSSDALILFKDDTGNIYYNVDYTVNQLLDTKEYIDLCIKDVRINQYMLLGDTFPILRAYKPAPEILEYFTSHRMAGQFRRGYEQELLAKVIAYYVKNSRDEQVHDALLKFREFELSPESRGQLIRIMLERNLYDDAFEEIREYGSCGLEKEDFARLANGYIFMHGMMEDPLLTRICETGYQADGFDEKIFNYLYLYYDGGLETLIDLYRSCRAYHKDAVPVAERILWKSINTGEHPAVVSRIILQYYEEGQNRNLVRKYLEFRSGVYLYGLMKGSADEVSQDTEFFEIMEKELARGYSFADDALAAFLLWRMESRELEERQIRVAEKVLKDLVRRGKMLEEFKSFARYFPLPSTLANNIIISAFSENPGEKPMIAYEITGSGHRRNGVEEMEEIFRRCYVKYFTLFYGEKVVFSMDGKENTEVRYSDLYISRDGSRYAALDDIIRRKEQQDMDGFRESAKEFFIKEKLIERLL
ncbi:MAG: hypothetical protein IJ106_15955 [Parasporobacterium sp.]|nr:hypothetical protein [Parasporobacterium sp.]